MTDHTPVFTYLSATGSFSDVADAAIPALLRNIRA
jgi:hypothetical protein